MIAPRPGPIRGPAANRHGISTGRTNLIYVRGETTGAAKNPPRRRARAVRRRRRRAGRRGTATKAKARLWRSSGKRSRVRAEGSDLASAAPDFHHMFGRAAAGDPRGLEIVLRFDLVHPRKLGRLEEIKPVA